MINTVSKINLSKVGWEGGGSTSIWIMSLNILLVFFTSPLRKRLERLRKAQFGECFPRMQKENGL